jgi:hypothetical protein
VAGDAAGDAPQPDGLDPGADGPEPEPGLEDALAAIDDMPRYDPASYQVLLPPHGRILGRIKPLHLGTPKEAVSVYCRIHGCAPGLRTRKNAHSVEAMLSWFQEGIDLPHGAPGKAAHLRAWQLIRRDPQP